MEVMTKVACGSVIAGGGGAAGAYGVHRWSVSQEQEGSQVTAPEALEPKAPATESQGLATDRSNDNDVSEDTEKNRNQGTDHTPSNQDSASGPSGETAETSQQQRGSTQEGDSRPVEGSLAPVTSPDTKDQATVPPAEYSHASSDNPSDVTPQTPEDPSPQGALEQAESVDNGRSLEAEAGS